MASDDQTLRKIWEKCELQFSILLSLLLQIILILSANRRKRSYSKLVAFVLWMAYLAADWVATYSLGIISRTLKGLNDQDFRHDPDVLAFWTPFLLLHLGGPDTITAFALEDSQLWLRHLLSLIFQFLAVGYIFTRSLQTNTKLFFPTIFVLAAGVLKYGERTWSLKQSSTDGLRKSLIKKQRNPGPDYAAVMEDFSSNLREGNPGMLTVEKENKSEPEYYLVMKKLLEGKNSNLTDPEKEHPEFVYGAYLFFETFKCLFVDLILTFQDRECSVFTFREYKSPQAYKMIEIELNYAYDMFYTKALVVHSTQGRIFRGISFCSIIIAFALFFSSVKHYKFQEEDIIVSYVLLAGALALEFISIGILIFSDWTVVMLLRRKPQLKWLAKPVFQILSRFRRFSKHRWSNHMGQYSLLSYTVDDQKHKLWEIFLDRLGLMEMWDEYMYIKYDMVSKETTELIFEHLKGKSNDNTEDLEKADKRLNISQRKWAAELPKNSPMLQRSIDAEFDEILIMWHVATDICFQLRAGKEDSEEKKRISDQREASKVVSRYLLYLLISRPSTMSSIAGLAVIRHGDTCEEAKKFFKEERVIGDKYEVMIKSLMDVHTYVPAEKVKGDKSKSILWNAVELARELQYLGEAKMWEIACNMWIEMLSYAARHCRGNYHAQTLSAGGELLTFVWLLEAHFGMGGHYQIKSGDFTTSFMMPEQP